MLDVRVAEVPGLHLHQGAGVGTGSPLDPRLCGLHSNAPPTPGMLCLVLPGPPRSRRHAELAAAVLPHQLRGGPGSTRHSIQGVGGALLCRPQNLGSRGEPDPTPAPWSLNPDVMLCRPQEHPHHKLRWHVDAAVLKLHSRRCTCLEFHPTKDNLVLSGDKKGQVGLHAGWRIHPQTWLPLTAAPCLCLLLTCLPKQHPQAPEQPFPLSACPSSFRKPLSSWSTFSILQPGLPAAGSQAQGLTSPCVRPSRASGACAVPALPASAQTSPMLAQASHACWEAGSVPWPLNPVGDHSADRRQRLRQASQALGALATQRAHPECEPQILKPHKRAVYRPRRADPEPGPQALNADAQAAAQRTGPRCTCARCTGRTARRP